LTVTRNRARPRPDRAADKPPADDGGPLDVRKRVAECLAREKRLGLTGKVEIVDLSARFGRRGPG
jgi:hypothetical protein